MRDTLMAVLELARWAPSGDNTQPWRFEIVNDALIRIHGSDTRDDILYDFDGHASHIAHGALLETLRIAASGFGLRTQWQASSSGDDRLPVYDVTLTPDPTLVKDPLFAFIETRTVQRRIMKTTPLTPAQRQALVSAAGDSLEVRLFESFGERLKMAKLLWRSAKIRLTCPEAFPVHSQIIEWHARFSKDRIPDQAVGVDPATALLMKWVMQSWARVKFFNKFLMGTIAPRIQLDFLTALGCAAHLLISPKKTPQTLEDWVHMGINWQRMWLTATQQGLHFQPEMTPVIFRWYARAGRRFSAEPQLFEQALQVSDELEEIAGASPTSDFGFLGRVGSSATPKSRSIRLDLADLMKA